MTRKTTRILTPAALCVAAIVILVAGQVQAAQVTSTILLGPPNGGPVGTFSASLTPGAGSQLHIGTISGNFKQHVSSFLNLNFGISASNQNSTLTLTPSSISTNNASGTAVLEYDNFTPGTPLFLDNFVANLSDGATAPVNIGASAVNVSFGSLGSFPITMNFAGTLSNVTFTTSPVPPAGTNPANPVYFNAGNYSVTISGAVTGSLVLPLGLGTLPLGTLFTLPATPVTFPGVLPGVVTLSDIGPNTPPYTGTPNDMLAQFAANLGAAQFPFSFSTPVNTSITNSIPANSSGVTQLTISGSSLNANIVLTNLQYDLRGITTGTLIPEPASVGLAGLALAGLVGFAIKRRKAA
ncbi:MAG: PEP-CTERM sorting domain-containing protein [Planctomycetia bacterium]|nr:PEP-CTERM sorting domain-containing protein [Planctomycetia bacterium]